MSGSVLHTIPIFFQQALEAGMVAEGVSVLIEAAHLIDFSCLRPAQDLPLDPVSF